MTAGLPLALRLARWEMRGGLKPFRLFVVCLGLGVAAIGGVGALGEAVNGGLERDARRLLGGDVALRLLHRRADPEARAYMEAAGEVSEVIEMRAMARASGAGGGPRALVELKAVDGAYPLIGRVRLKNDLSLAQALAPQDGIPGAVVEPNLPGKLGAGVGAIVQVGDARFRINGIIAREPDRITGILSLGPRLMIGADALTATGLVQPGSQIRYRYRVALDPGTEADAWIEALKAQFPKAGWRIRSFHEAAPGLRRFIERMTLFLTFVGLTTLLVGGIGVSNAVGNYMDAKTTTIATLKCLGCEGGLVMRIYLIQVLALAALGIALGLLVAAGVPMAGALALQGRLPVELDAGLHAWPLVLAAAFGGLTAITFSLWPLGRSGRVSAASLFRDRVDPARAAPGWTVRGWVAGGGAALIALTLGTASHLGFALWFVGGAIATMGALRGAAWGLARLAARIRTGRWTVARLALANLHRPGAATRSIVVSLGLGLAVLVAVALIEANLSRQIDERLPKRAPAFFFIDIQPHQVAGFDKVIAGLADGGDYRRVATLRGRIVAIAGVPVEKARIGAGAAWAVRGDRALTYLPRPFEGARITAGKWWPADYEGPPLISLDANLARGFGVGLGDTLTLNILGREFEARIASLREIDWRSLRFDFAIIFSPGTLEGAPHSHIAALQAPPEREDGIERAVADRFANVSVIRVREALKAAADILAAIGAAVRATSAVTILAGALVLAGAIAAARRRRIYDSVVLKVLGASRRTLLAAFALEYGILGLATGVIAAAVGGLTAWAIVVWLMHAQWTFFPGTVAWVVALAMGVTLIAGFAGSWRALGQKAAPYLRNE